MFYLIYQVHHKRSGKVYIGKHQTTNVDDGYMGSGLRLRRAIKKHGADAFTKTILHTFDNEAEMNAKEAELVTEEFCARKDTYNICPGGQGGFGYINRAGLSQPRNGGLAHTREHMTVIGAKGAQSFHQKRMEQPERYDTWSSNLRHVQQTTFLGKAHTLETKERISRSCKGKNSGYRNGNFGKFWITNGSADRMISHVDQVPAGWRKGRMKTQ